jgi:hypothetical protein
MFILLPFKIPEEANYLLIVNGESSTCLVLGMSDSEGWVRGTLTIKLDSKGCTFVCLCELRREGYDVVWYEGVQEDVCFEAIKSPNPELFVIMATGLPLIKSKGGQHSLTGKEVPKYNPLSLKDWCSVVLLINGMDRVAMLNEVPTLAHLLPNVITRQVNMFHPELDFMPTCHFSFHDWAYFMAIIQ